MGFNFDAINYDLLIIPCSSRKNKGKMGAEDLYRGHYFEKNLKAALMITNRDNIRILSTKYGLIKLDDIIEDYDLYLQWSSRKSLKECFYKTLKDSSPSLRGSILSFCSSIYDGFMNNVYGDSINITNFYNSNDLLGSRVIKVNNFLECKKKWDNLKLIKDCCVVIGCGKIKLPYADKAESLYNGKGFKILLSLAKTFSKKIYIFSAEYGLVNLTDRIEPYENFLRKGTQVTIRRDILENLPSSIISLCSTRYNEALLSLTKKNVIPFFNSSMKVGIRRKIARMIIELSKELKCPKE